MSNKQKIIPMRDGFGVGLTIAGEKNNRVLAMTADLGESLKMQSFAEKFPDRFIQVGIAEQNMAGIAAGLALSGFIPYIGSFACFQPMRNLDQIRTSICIMNANVKIVSSHAGFSFAADGVQIQALEDLAIMRVLPNMRVIVPADAEQAEKFTTQMLDHTGPEYLRLGRLETELLSASKLVDKEVFTEPVIGQAQHLTAGGDATIIACGYMTRLALQAAQELREDGIHATVINMHTIKPIDERAILQAAEHTGRIVTVEEHQASGGLGGAVAEVLTQAGSASRLRIIGVNDSFGKTARTTEELWHIYGLTSQAIKEAVSSII